MTTEGPSPPEDNQEPIQPPPPAAPTPPPVIGEPTKSGMSGCAKAAIYVGVVVVVFGVVAVIAIFFLVRKAFDNVEESFVEAPCEYLSNEQASEALGTDVEAFSNDGMIGEILGVLQDTRLLSDSPSCFISDDHSAIQIWISVYDGSDAADVFASWAGVADGQVVSQSSDESGSLTVETDAFRGDDVPGLGEEAFCVDVGFTASGGVFARSDDRVVYVTVLALEENEGAEVFDGSTCERAEPVAEALLG